jgi:hypothetical protein
MRPTVFALAVLLAPACAADELAQGEALADGLVSCTGRPFAAPAATSWRHLTSRLIVLAGAPRHVAQDVIATPGDGAELTGKLAYGAVWKDLEDERVAAFVDDCEGWRGLGEAVTDDDGEVSFRLDDDLAFGEHEVRLVVRGDRTQAVASLWVLPDETHVVVTDIDGTLTTSDGELFQQILTGSHVPEAYEGAADLTYAHDSIDHVVVYLTGRPYWLLSITRTWLDALGFAPGPVHAATTNADILPIDASVGDYKADWLRGLVADGLLVDLAYGNATTDIYAYGEAGIAAEDTWIIGAHAGEAGTHAVADTWAPRADEVAASPPVDQPF